MVNERDYVVTFPSEEEEVLDNSKNQIYLISTFNAFASLSVLIGRIINSIYSIGIRVSSQTDDILSILDQSLSSWYLSLPLHLQYTPGSGSHNILLPHVYSLHLAFYSALILLHRPL